MYKVFADLHHNALFESLRILFEDRLSGSLYRPIGMEWFPDYWAVYTGPGKEATAHQYLGLDQSTKRPTDIRGQPLDDQSCLNLNYQIEDGIYYVKDIVVDKINRAVTFDKFKEMKFDILLCSMPQHIPMFMELQSKFQPQAKLIFQAGNAWGADKRIKNFMGSIAKISVPQEMTSVFYHQEFDAKVFNYAEPRNKNAIYSFVHYMQNISHMNEVRARLPGWEVASFGAGMSSSLMRTADVAGKIKDSTFVWHNKPGGDGFGHTIHSTYACGRPAIIWGSQYRGKLAGELMEHNKTCLDVEKLGSLEATAERIKQVVSTDEHKQMCEAARAKFEKVVDYDREFVDISKFLSNLI